MNEETIGLRLVKEGILNEDQLCRALERQKTHGGRLGANLIALGVLTKEKLDAALKKKPAAPKDIEDTGLSQSFITGLMLKIVLNLGEFNIPEVAERMKLPVSVVDQALQVLRKERFVEVKGGSDYARTSYQHILTSAGRNRAIELLDLCHYSGPAPVTLDAYRTFSMLQTIKHSEIKEEEIRASFSQITIKNGLIKQVGPAITSGKSLFLYGPPGNGKTTIAQIIGNLFKEIVYIPYAIYVGGQIITLYNPVNHQAVDEAVVNGFDHRWVPIQRPFVMVGGELTLDMLELGFNTVSKFYDAPLQMKANNGVLVIDDFGRQLVKPQDLLNRWIVPLDRKIDYMTLHTGLSFEVPFDQLLIFSTNIAPRELVDEAFLRRIRYKVEVGYPTEEGYREIFTKVCKQYGIEFREEIFTMLMDTYRKSGIKLCACHPRDLLEHIVDLSHYYNTPPVLNRETMELAWHNYMVE